MQKPGFRRETRFLHLTAQGFGGTIPVATGINGATWSGIAGDMAVLCALIAGTVVIAWLLVGQRESSGPVPWVTRTAKS
jgi:hypothetical protein